MSSPVEAYLAQQMGDARPGLSEFELPCGYLDPSGELHTSVRVREMRGREEDLLASKAIPSAKKMTELLAGCTVQLGSLTDRREIVEAVRNLPIGDRVFLMLAIRRVTLGDDYPFEAKCPECDAKHTYMSTLSELKLKPMQDPRVRSFDRVLPNGVSVKFRVMTGLDEERLASEKNSENDKLTLSLLTRIEALNGQKPSLAVVKDLSLGVRSQLREWFEEVEGGVDTEIEVQCLSCSHEFKTDVDVSQAGFFFPSRARKT